MHINNITIAEFTEFEENHPLGSYYQTVNYAMYMAEKGYDYDLVGLFDYNNNLVASSLILLKPIGNRSYYGYAPRGILIDYSNAYLVNSFTECLKEYYANKDVVFIKVNPNLPIGKINNDTYIVEYNNNKNINDILIDSGYKKLYDNLYFEAQLPRFNAFIDLNNFSAKTLQKNTRNKVKKATRKGLVLEKVSRDYINILYNLLKNKEDFDEYTLEDFYTVFSRNEEVDLFLVSIDYEAFQQNSQYIYSEELEKNNKLNAKLAEFNSEKNINAKMNSDKTLLSYKNDIMEATKGMSENRKEYIAGALVVKHNNIASIVYSTYDKKYKRFAPNYFLHYNLIKYYKDSMYDYLDLNGIVGDFTKDNPYSGLNRFKLGFNPLMYEYIGEYDLIIDDKAYNILLQNGSLAKEFNKK